MKLIEWMDRHKIFSIIAMIWLGWLVTAVTMIAFINPPDMNSAVATVLVAIWGVPALIVGLLKWRGEIITKRGSE